LTVLIQFLSFSITIAVFQGKTTIFLLLAVPDFLAVIYELRTLNSELSVFSIKPVHSAEGKSEKREFFFNPFAARG